MKNKVMSILLTLSMVIGMVPVFGVSAFAVAKDWSYDSGTKTMTIHATADMADQSAASAYGWYSESAEMERLIVEKGVTHIGSVAFNQAVNLKTVTLAESVTSIGQGAFGQCVKLEKVYVNASSCTIGATLSTGLKAINNNAQIIVPDDKLASYKDSWTAYTGQLIGKSDELIWEYTEGTLTVFSGIIPDFEGSNYAPWAANKADVTSVVIGAGVKSIGKYAFAGMKKLKSVSFNNTNNIVIGEAAFLNDEKLERIYIPATVTGIKSAAFAGSGMTAVTIKGTDVSLENNNSGFMTFPDNAVITVPEGNGAFYRAKDGWKTLKCTIVSPDEYVAEIAAGDETSKFTSLQTAVDAATEGQTVTLLKDAELTKSLAILSKNLVLNIDTHSITNKMGRAISIANSTVTITGTGFVTGIGTVCGGGINVCQDSDVTIENITVKDCVAVNEFGGGICVENGSLTLKNVTITNCSAYSGGGLYVKADAAKATLQNCTVEGNKATSFGAGICFQGKSTGQITEVIMDGCSITGNTADFSAVNIADIKEDYATAIEATGEASNRNLLLLQAAYEKNGEGAMGAGVFAAKTVKSFELKGKTVIKDNTIQAEIDGTDTTVNSNLYIFSKNDTELLLNVANLASGSEVYVATRKTLENLKTDLTSREAVLATGAAGLDFLKSDLAAVSLTAKDNVIVTALNVANVNNLIDAIGKVEYSDNSKAKIDAAAEAYDSLSDAQKAQNTKVHTLMRAMRDYAVLALEAMATNGDSNTVAEILKGAKDAVNSDKTSTAADLDEIVKKAAEDIVGQRLSEISGGTLQNTITGADGGIVKDITRFVATNDYEASISVEDLAAAFGVDTANGEQAYVWMELECCGQDATVLPVGDAERISAGLKGKKLASYLSIEVYKLNANGIKTKVTEMPYPLTVTITVPEELRGGYGREFAIIYTHDGSTAVTIVPVSYNRSTGELKFLADRFSTYALVYTDVSYGSRSYSITVPQNIDYGQLTTDKNYASSGQTVTITVTPEKGYLLETIQVIDKNGKEVKLTEKNGSYFFTMPKSQVAVIATFAENNAGQIIFADVPADAYYKNAVLWAAGEGITTGTDPAHFSPDLACTRAQVVTFLWRAAGSPSPLSGAMSFADVTTDDYYHDAVLWAVEQGITKGTSDVSFTPDAICTRGQIVTFLFRAEQANALNAGENPFDDVSQNAYYYDAVLWAVERGITKGTSQSTFSPDIECTRAQVVTFLYRAMGE